ncbi:hypothetical protein E6C27_scaffold8315G00020 [Cucumis melo var. makuwa]|uniref:Uncharacterized protein n=1 Tax=Cucumis melo var. makuwa TaxID=1194695 RepID=A0A5A7T6J9_CUCMM|nr:hypothetical protein E6C27_scaffold8315G00020 [Cucumis melo var. makuwa]
MQFLPRANASRRGGPAGAAACDLAADGGRTSGLRGAMDAGHAWSRRTNRGERAAGPAAEPGVALWASGDATRPALHCPQLGPCGLMDKASDFGSEDCSGGIRTHASEETGALNQRLRPLGHATSHGRVESRSNADVITATPRNLDESTAHRLRLMSLRLVPVGQDPRHSGSPLASVTTTPFRGPPRPPRSHALWPERRKTNRCDSRESNPDQLLGRQLC